jgi:hypothetical protein
MPRILKLFGRKHADQDTNTQPPTASPGAPPADPASIDTPTIADSTSSSLSDDGHVGGDANDDAGGLQGSSQPASVARPDMKAGAPSVTPTTTAATTDADPTSGGDDERAGALQSPGQPADQIQDAVKTPDPVVIAPPQDPSGSALEPDPGSGPATQPLAPSTDDALISLHVDAHPIAESPAPIAATEPRPPHTSPFAATPTSALSAKIGGAPPDHEPAPSSAPFARPVRPLSNPQPANHASQPDSAAEAPLSSLYRGRVEHVAPPDDAASTTASKTLIGGREADIVPLIPDSKAEIDSQEFDDEAVAGATVEALRAACDLMVTRVNKIVTLHDGGQIITAMIALVTELDARYAVDWGVVRRNGVQEVLDQVYGAIAEGDRFILESLENGRGGLTAEEFVRDLRTVAESDRPRIVTEYSSFLVFVIRCVLRQYLRPLDNDQMRLRDVSRRLDFLVDGVRDVLSARINSGIRAG